MAAEGKYGRITTEFGDIPEDEPVFLLRGRDAATVAAIQSYEAVCVALGSPQRHLNGVQEARERIRMWQQENRSRVRVPQSKDLPEP